MTDLQGGITSSFPITALVTPGDSVWLHLVYDANRLDEPVADHLLTQFAHVLERISVSPEIRAGDLIETVGLERNGPREASEATQYARVGRKRPLNTAKTQTEQTLADIWEDVLKVSPISVTDGFFELGGDSISSLQIIARANEAGLTLKSSDFFEHPTIRGLASALDHLAPARDESHLVPLAPEGTQPPLFIIHGWGGKVFKYRALARRLGEDQPVFGIQDVDHDSPQDRFESFDAMIDQYVSVIRTQQPHGPYAFLGFSVGGTIAYAIALRFLSAGETVRRLFILDTVPYNLPRWVRFRMLLPFIQARARHHARSLLRAPAQVVRRARSVVRSVQNEFRKPPEPVDGPVDIEMPEGQDYYRALMRYYVPERCTLPVTLIKTTVNAEKFDYPVAWRYLTGPDLTLFTLDTDHDGLILKTDVRNRVADIVRQQLERG